MPRIPRDLFYFPKPEPFTLADSYINTGSPLDILVSSAGMRGGRKRAGGGMGRSASGGASKAGSSGGGGGRSRRSGGGGHSGH